MHCQQTINVVKNGKAETGHQRYRCRDCNKSFQLVQSIANWQHRYQHSKRSGRMMWAGLPLEEQTVPIEAQTEASLQKLSTALLDRLIDLLHQELNYAFNVES